VIQTFVAQESAVAVVEAVEEKHLLDAVLVVVVFDVELLLPFVVQQPINPWPCPVLDEKSGRHDRRQNLRHVPDCPSLAPPFAKWIETAACHHEVAVAVFVADDAIHEVVDNAESVVVDDTVDVVVRVSAIAVGDSGMVAAAAAAAADTAAVEHVVLAVADVVVVDRAAG
jgi:hypothetical protein